MWDSVPDSEIWQTNLGSLHLHCDAEGEGASSQPGPFWTDKSLSLQLESIESQWEFHWEHSLLGLCHQVLMGIID